MKEDKSVSHWTLLGFLVFTIGFPAFYGGPNHTANAASDISRKAESRAMMVDTQPKVEQTEELSYSHALMSGKTTAQLSESQRKELKTAATRHNYYNVPNMRLLISPYGKATFMSKSHPAYRSMIAKKSHRDYTEALELLK